MGLLPSYHLVVSTPSEYAYSCTEQQLEDHFKVLTATPHCARMSSSAAHVTFDDGHASQFRYGFPLLQKHGVRGIFFVIAGWTGQRPDYMTSAQLRELAAAGHEVQSHGLSHVPLTQSSDAELAQELEGSKEELEQRLGMGVDAVSIPFGRWDQRVLRACAEAGYKRVYTSDPSPARWFSQVEVVGRFMVRRSTTLEQLDAVAAGDHNALRRMQATHHCKLAVRAVIGERRYFHLWSILASHKSLEAARNEY